MDAAPVEWGVIIARVLMSAGLVATALTNSRTAELGGAVVFVAAVPMLYTPLLAYLLYRGAVVSEVIVSAALDTATILTGITLAAAVIGQKVAENANAMTPDQVHQVEHDIYRPMLALVMFVALRLRPTWAATFVICSCAGSLGLILLVAGNAFVLSSLAFQYTSLAITGIAAVVVSMFIQQTRDDLEDALDDRSDLIQIVTHEVGNPLAALKASLEMTRDEYSDKMDDDFRRLIRVANNSVSRIESLARNLSALRSVDARVEPPRLSPVVLGAVIQFAVDSMQPLAVERNVEIEIVEGDTGKHIALANHDAVDRILEQQRMLGRILINLISNAVKYSPDGSHVRIVISENDDSVNIAVEDQGPGIADSEKPMLFQRYYRASNALERKVPGSGLGLFICRGLALRMGGNVTVADRPSGGSVFAVILRRADVPES